MNNGLNQGMVIVQYKNNYYKVNDIITRWKDKHSVNIEHLWSYENKIYIIILYKYITYQFFNVYNIYIMILSLWTILLTFGKITVKLM